ncbi:MAG: hypothetical protein AAFN08_03055 [Cyanobacteria bacterium J06559_3]
MTPFQTVFKDIEVTAVPDPTSTVINPVSTDGPVNSPQNSLSMAASSNATLPTGGEVVLTITKNRDNIQVSNFGNNSFQITNTGTKKIAQVDIDVTGALYPDSIFDPFGLAGDTVGKALTINTNGGTGIVAPSNASYIGAGGTAGFEGLQLRFDETVNGGFESGETVGFSVDMDPNSIAGARKGVLDSGTSPAWDVGGVSGAELIGSSFTVTFTDGTTATGQLQGVGNQGGSQALASQDSPNVSVSLTVNGLGAGDIGTYDANGPSVIVNGPAGQTTRVVLTKGFIQPVINEFFNGNASDQAYAPILQAQLDALAASDFPANNAVEFQTVDVVLTGADQDISDQFDFSGVAAYDFAGEDQLPLGFAASVIDPTNDDLPLGPVTEPIYVEFSESDTTPAATIGEYGSLDTLNHNWQTIALDNTYTNPVVIVSDPTFNGSDPAAIRLRNVTGNTFQLQLQEPNYKDGWHVPESVSYLVMEAGDWTLADGTRIAAGTYGSNRLTSKGFDTVNIAGFDTTPTVLSQVQTANGSDWIVTRTREQSPDSFQLAMQEEEALNESGHTNESIGWLAIAPGTASDGDTLLQAGTTGGVYEDTRSTVDFGADFDTAPALIAKLGSYRGSNTANLRLDTITNNSFGVRVYEEKSFDDELDHVGESVSFLALEGESGVLTGLGA